MSANTLQSSENSTGALPAVLSVYQNPEFKVRGLVREGEPWFVAKDVCEVLGIVWKGSGSLGALEDDERSSLKVDTVGGNQDLLLISESGLYALIFRSSKPEARVFRRWVTAEVLPAIRREGVYRLRSLDQQRIKELEASVAGARQALEKRVDAYWAAQDIPGHCTLNVYVAAAGLGQIGKAQRVGVASTLRMMCKAAGEATGYQPTRRTPCTHGYHGWHRAKTWPPRLIAAALREHDYEFTEPDSVALTAAEELYRPRFTLKASNGAAGLPKASVLRRDEEFAAKREQRHLAAARRETPLDITHGQEVRA